MAERMTELDLVVGSMITTTPEEDRDQYEEERGYVADVQDLLRDEGIEVDLLSQPGTEVWEGGIDRIYDLYQLQRLAAHLEQGNDVTNLLNENMDGEDVDDLLADIWDEEAPTRFPHLIKHQVDGGYYLPVEFAEPIWASDALEDEDEDDFEDDEDTSVSFGSSVALVRELTELEGMLQQANVNQPGVRQALQVLRDGAQQSVQNGLPLILW